MFLLDLAKSLKTNFLEFIKNESKQQYFIKLSSYLENAYRTKDIFPKKELIFSSLNYFDINETKVVILGQDPYHKQGLANGLAFSSNTTIPVSLRNLFNEIKSDYNYIRTNPNLTDWAEQKILLYNPILSVEKDKALSHKGIGWEMFSTNLLTYLAKQNKNVIYLLMGKWALNYLHCFENNNLSIIQTSHPSFFSYSKNLKDKQVFLKINQILKANRLDEIKW